MTTDGKCSCGSQKFTYGTSVRLCPECDFARCVNKACAEPVEQLVWRSCPKCYTRQDSVAK